MSRSNLICILEGKGKYMEEYKESVEDFYTPLDKKDVFSLLISLAILNHEDKELIYDKVYKAVNSIDETGKMDNIIIEDLLDIAEQRILDTKTGKLVPNKIAKHILKVLCE